MFNQIYKRASTAAHHFASPLADERLRYLSRCAAQGTTQSRLRAIAQTLLVIIEQMNLPTERVILPEHIQAAAQQWAFRQPPYHCVKDAHKARANFISVATQWLRFLGWLQVPVASPLPEANLVAEFADYLDRERGLSPATIHTQCWNITEFLRRFCGQHRPLHEISVIQLDEALARKGEQDGYTRRSIQSVAESLRSFFRYAEQRGWCRPGLAAAIKSPRVYQDEGIPAGPAWPDVQRLLAEVATDHSTDIRDRAIILLLAIYGWRSAEVRGLRLEDLDWEKAVISVTRHKSRCTQRYPLVPTVGEAILRYLKEVRPRSSYRELFLTMQAPVQPLSRSGLWNVVGPRLHQLGLSLKHFGPHALRHSCATHLLAQGLSLQAIGDHLGHRSPDATRTYAKVDIVGLNAVADFDLGGLI
jgi:site-specific recombinase XerD